MSDLSAQTSLACYVISLNADGDDTVSLCDALAEQGITAKVFPAVDGRNGYPDLQEGEKKNVSLAMIRNKRYLTASEMGCYLSHYRAIKAAFDDGREFVCALEDDVVIEPQFAAVLLALLDRNLEMVRLMALKLRRRKVLGEIAAGVQLTRPERGTLGTQAYLMNREGMRKFLAHASSIYEAIDHVFDHFYLFDLDTYSVEPHIAYEQARESSIKKRPAAASRVPTLLERLAFRPVKLYFSLRRHLYLWRRRKDFYPAEFADVRPGKSPRLRGKGLAAKALD